MKANQIKTTIYFLSLFLLPIQCMQETPPAEDHEDDRAHSTQQLIQLSREQIETAGIAWGAVTQKSYTGTLKLNGELRVPEMYIAEVSAYADGIISSMNTSLNKSVKKGELLAKVRHPQLIDWQMEFLEVTSDLEFLKANADRYETLKNENATALKNYESAAAALKKAKTRRTLLATKLEYYGVDASTLKPDNITDEYRVRAPVSGIVAHTHVSPGSAVSTGTPICTILPMDRLQADIFVFEKDLGKVEIGQIVELSIPGSSSPFKGKVYSIDPELDPERKALRAHARLIRPLPKGLVNGAYINANLLTGENKNTADALPDDAVIQTINGHSIYILESESESAFTFTEVPVNILQVKEGFTIFRPGTALPENAQVVLEGAFYVSSQKAALEGEHEH